MTMTKDLQNEQDLFEFIKSKKVVMVKFFTDLCVPCKEMTVKLERLGEQGKLDMEIMNVNAKDFPNLNEEYSIRKVPTLLFFKEERMVSRESGNLTTEKLGEVLKKLKEKYNEK